ncbi:MAG: hypothetical protein ACOCYU_07135 [Brevefilum sp.]
MNRKIGVVSSIVNLLAVIGFALSMLLGSDFCSYITSMFIAFSFVPMISTFAAYSRKEAKAAGNTAMIFASVYTVFILMVYFAQVTSVRLEPLSEQAARILDYQKFGLFFNFDLLGYGIMALSTFFAGFTIDAQTKTDRWLKGLLLLHGIFFFSSLILPMLGLFSQEMQGADWVGTAVLIFWCVYFAPIGVLSFLFFKCRG